MLGSITPLGERGRGSRWGITVSAYIIGSAAGGAALGSMLGWAGSPLDLSADLRLAILGVAIAAGVAFVALRGDPTTDEPAQPSTRPVSTPTQPATRPAVDARPEPKPEPKATAVNADTGSARPDAAVNVGAKPSKPALARPIKPASKPKKPPGDDDDAPM